MIPFDMKKNCPLCNTSATLFYEDVQKYYNCPLCYGIFVDADDLPDAVSEKQRYELHDSDTEDERYRKFVSPITSSIIKDFSNSSVGLDFGAGTSAIISAVLEEYGYRIDNYDPYFHKYPKLLENRYDFISSCEVIEHFYNPHKEFGLLKEMLKPEGRLYLMTDIYDGRDFSSWYYKNDPTHVFLYHKKTFEWIRDKFGFADVSVHDRLIVFFNEREL